MSHLGFITLCSVAAFFCCCLVSLIESFGSIMGISFDGAGLYYVGNDGCFACLLIIIAVYCYCYGCCDVSWSPKWFSQVNSLYGCIFFLILVEERAP